MDYNPPSSSVHRILQARILERVAVPSSVCMYHAFICPSVDGHLVCFYVLATVDKCCNEPDVLYTTDTTYKVDNWEPIV